MGINSGVDIVIGIEVTSNTIIPANCPLKVKTIGCLEGCQETVYKCRGCNQPRDDCECDLDCTCICEPCGNPVNDCICGCQCITEHNCEDCRDCNYDCKETCDLYCETCGDEKYGCVCESCECHYDTEECEHENSLVKVLVILSTAVDTSPRDCDFDLGYCQINTEYLDYIRQNFPTAKINMYIQAFCG